LYLTQTSHKIQAPFALRKVSCWTLHLAVASRNGFESMKSKVFKDIGVAAWSTRIRSSKAAPAPWHKAHKIYFRKPGSKWNLLCRIQWTELSSALRSAPKFMIKLAPSWPEANRTRRSKSEPGRLQQIQRNGEAVEMAKPSGSLMASCWMSLEFQTVQNACKWRSTEKHFKKISRNILHFIRITTTCYETYLNALDRDRKWLHLPKKCPAKVYQAQTSVEHLELQGRKQQAVVSQWNLERRTTKLPQCCTKWTCWNQAVEVMSVTF